MTPTRVQRKRTKGYKQPSNTRYCGRGTKYGNPHKVQKGGISKWDAHKYAMWFYAKDMIEKDKTFYDELLSYDYLSCFCALDMPCHVDAIIEHLKRREVELSAK